MTAAGVYKVLSAEITVYIESGELTTFRFPKVDIRACALSELHRRRTLPEMLDLHFSSVCLRSCINGSNRKKPQLGLSGCTSRAAATRPCPHYRETVRVSGHRKRSPHARYPGNCWVTGY